MTKSLEDKMKEKQPLPGLHRCIFVEKHIKDTIQKGINWTNVLLCGAVLKNVWVVEGEGNVGTFAFCSVFL